MEAQLKGAVFIALVVVPQWRCPILKPLSAKLPLKSENAPHPGWQDSTILGPGLSEYRRVFALFEFLGPSEKYYNLQSTGGKLNQPVAALDLQFRIFLTNIHPWYPFSSNEEP